MEDFTGMLVMRKTARSSPAIRRRGTLADSVEEGPRRILHISSQPAGWHPVLETVRQHGMVDRREMEMTTERRPGVCRRSAHRLRRAS
jgi:hypothetical protein